MPRENKQLTTAIVDAIDVYDRAHPGKVSVGMIVISFLAIWRLLWGALPEGKSSEGPQVAAPPRTARVVSA